MKIKLLQSGGYAGLIRDTGDIDLNTVPEDERRQLNRLVEESGILHTQGQPETLKKGADLQQYEITINTPEGGMRKAFFNDITLPERVAPLVEYLLERAKPTSN